MFALGDSHYWPRKEDKHYYNKPGKDVDRVLANLGGKRLAEIGLGDDQDPDSYQTGYQIWEPLIWQALGVDKVDGIPDDPPRKSPSLNYSPLGHIPAFSFSSLHACV